MGNTNRIGPTDPWPSVHPHTHGEHLGRDPGLINPAGSSPHAWGTLTVAVLNVLETRFIPTRMGNTGSSGGSVGGSSVHPHTHGEHIFSKVGDEHSVGSSPHAWGTLRARVPRTRPFRFIPTRMGNTVALFSSP